MLPKMFLGSVDDVFILVFMPRPFQEQLWCHVGLLCYVLIVCVDKVQGERRQESTETERPHRLQLPRT